MPFLTRNLWMSNATLRAKLAALFALVIGAISLFVFLFFPAALKRQAESALAGKAQSIGALTAFSVAPALVFDDDETIREVLRGALQSGDVLYVEVTDPSGRVLAAAPAARQPAFNRQEVEGPQARDDQAVHRLSTPIEFQNRKIGHVRLGLSLEGLHADVQRLRELGGLVSAAIFLVGMVAIILGSTLVTGPLSKMARTVESIAAGDLSQRAPVQSRDEVGQFAQAFNAMVGHLESAHNELAVVNHKLEERLFELRRQVEERRRAERALQESEEQLRQAQKMEAVGRLAGGVAHDFNNLLTVIIGNARMLALDLDSDCSAQAEVEQITKAAEGAAGLTRQLLAFSRKQVMQPTTLHLNDVIVDTETMLRRLIGEHIELVTSLSPDLWPVKVDRSQMEQVILNLTVNARDAMPGGGTLILETANAELDDDTALARPEILPGRYVRVTVSDSGTGMDPNTLARIFEPFFSTKGPGKGTGLGLATVYGIVKQSGGYVYVDTEVSRGTTFTVYLPVGQAAQTATSRSESSQTANGGRETILLVEDKDNVRALALRVLQHYGYNVLEARDAEEALEIFRIHSDSIQLLLTDVVMPGMNGKELADALANTRPATRVLYMSGYTDNEIARCGILDEEIAFIQKPFTPDGLIQKVRDVLDAAAVGGVAGAEVCPSSHRSW